MEVFIKNRDATLYTIIFPNRGKESVIFLHGGPAAPYEMLPIADFLSRDFQVIIFHQRGTLKSPCFSQDYSIERYLSDIDCLAQHLRLQKFHLLGHSWGGLYAQFYAHKRPHRLLSLFLCSPAPGPGWQWVQMGREVGRFNRKRSTARELLSLTKNTFLGLLGRDEGYQKAQLQFCITNNKGYSVKETVPIRIGLIKAKPINRTNLAILLHPKLPTLANPGFPITVTYGDDDIIGKSKRHVVNRYPLADVFIIPQCSHFHWLQNERVFFDILAQHFFRGGFR